MTIATLTTRGRVTLPVEVRKKLDLFSGDHIELYCQADGNIALRSLKGTVKDLKGIVPILLKAASVERLTRERAGKTSMDATPNPLVRKSRTVSARRR